MSRIYIGLKRPPQGPLRRTAGAGFRAAKLLAADPADLKGCAQVETLPTIQSTFACRTSAPPRLPLTCSAQAKKALISAWISGVRMLMYEKLAARAVQGEDSRHASAASVPIKNGPPAGQHA